MNRKICLLALASAVTLVCAKPNLDDFYWQDYDGVVPTNALPAGYSASEQPIYIGQVPHEDMTIPGKLYNDDTNIYYEFGEHGWSSNSSVKILCTDLAVNFEWIPTDVDGVDELEKNVVLVKGGYQPNFRTFIGRIQIDGGTEVGKVICRQKRTCLALYVNQDNQYEEYHEFEILAYNKDNENNIEVL